MGRSATRADVARCNALERTGAEIRGPEVFLNRIITPNKLPDYSCTAVQLYSWPYHSGQLHTRIQQRYMAVYTLEWIECFSRERFRTG